MVLKSYECTVCNFEFSAFENDTDCPHCGSKSRRVLGPFGIAAAALPNKGRAVIAQHQRDVNLDYDRDAYKRLRREGHQPTRIDGAYDMERRAATAREIRVGKVQPDSSIRERQAEGDAMSREGGFLK